VLIVINYGLGRQLIKMLLFDIQSKTLQNISHKYRLFKPRLQIAETQTCKHYIVN